MPSMSNNRKNLEDAFTLRYEPSEVYAGVDAEPREHLPPRTPDGGEGPRFRDSEGTWSASFTPWPARDRIPAPVTLARHFYHRLREIPTPALTT